MTRILPLPLLLAAALGLAACGSSSKSSSSTSTSGTNTKATTTDAATAGFLPLAPGADLAAAAHPSKSAFPAARGRSLNALIRGVPSVGDVGQATGTYVPGTDRFAFELVDKQQRFIYGPSAVYIAKNPNAPAQGPFLAPADTETVAAQYRSKTAEQGGAPPAVLAAHVPIPRAGTYAVLTLTRYKGRLRGGATQIAARASNPIPAVGQQAPVIDTSKDTTRIPPEQMHAVSFKQVAGKRPAALLFATPALCQSRVCAPVTDVLVSLQKEFGSRIAFIHQEVYVGNNPSKGYRAQMKAYHLQTEPWLFTVDRHGRIAARLEGTFGRTEVAAALKAAER